MLGWSWGLISPSLVALNVFLEMTLPDQEYELIFQLVALLYCVSNVFVIEVVLSPILVCFVSYGVRTSNKTY